MKKIYGNGEDCKYQFIISASAKNKVWHNRIETRQAGFSGLGELIEIIAQVFDLNIAEKSTDELKSEIINLMQGSQGILFLDNLEEINDLGVWKFLKDEIPEPVKVLVTSRTKRDIGARSIPVPQMTKNDARSLFHEELDAFHYYKFYEEEEEVNEILDASGYLPLAIKWAASMIIPCRSLKEVSSQFRKFSSTKKSFLDFCYSTMYDSLSPLARETALCIPFLSENANSSNISLLLEKSIADIDDAMSEMEDKGLIFFHSDIERKAFFVLPLTIDFLTEKLNQDGNFKKKLISISAENEGIYLPKKQQVEVYYQRASILERQGEKLVKASHLVNSALQTINKEGIEVTSKFLRSLQFLDGKIIYQLKEYNKGITRMIMAIEKENESFFVADDFLFLVGAIFNFGSGKDEDRALHLFAKYYSNASLATRELMQEYFNRIKMGSNKESLELFLKNLILAKHAYWFADSMWNEINDHQFSLIMGEELIPILKLATTYSESDKEKIQMFLGRINELQVIFKSLAK